VSNCRALARAWLCSTDDSHDSPIPVDLYPLSGLDYLRGRADVHDCGNAVFAGGARRRVWKVKSVLQFLEDMAGKGFLDFAVPRHRLADSSARVLKPIVPRAVAK
jgi:hypothetical protein